MRTAPLVLLTCVVLAGDASAQSSCSKIADDKERLACFDKGASVEQNAAPVEKTPNSRAAFAQQLRRSFLSVGVSMDVSAYEKNQKHLDDALLTKYRGLYPRLVFTGHVSDPRVFQVVARRTLKNAAALGFAGVLFISEVGGGLWLYDISGATLPRYDVASRLCL